MLTVIVSRVLSGLNVSLPYVLGIPTPPELGCREPMCCALGPRPCALPGGAPSAEETDAIGYCPSCRRRACRADGASDPRGTASYRWTVPFAYGGAGVVVSRAALLALSDDEWRDCRDRNVCGHGDLRLAACLFSKGVTKSLVPQLGGWAWNEAPTDALSFHRVTPERHVSLAHNERAIDYRGTI